jgi:rubredoxin
MTDATATATATATDAIRMECRICWHVYDPSAGDELRQVAPGTAFSDLSEDWRCPNCDAARELFLVRD